MRTPTIKVQRPYGNSHSFRRKQFEYRKTKDSETTNEEYVTGHYIGALTVSIYGDTNHEITNLEIRFKNRRFVRQYAQYFSDHGLQMVCARFVNDVLKAYIDA